jgi:hypothetical protein
MTATVPPVRAAALWRSDPFGLRARYGGELPESAPFEDVPSFRLWMRSQRVALLEHQHPALRGRPADRQDAAQAPQPVDLAACIRRGALQAEDATQAARRAARALERALGIDGEPARWSTVSRAGGLS